MNTTRRDWMAGALGFGLVPATKALAVGDAYERVGTDIMVGLAAYSFRNHFEFMRGEPNRKLAEGAPVMDMPKFIEFCAEHGVEGAELTSYFFPPDADTAYFAKCRKIAHINGVAVAGTAVGNNFSYPKEAPERAEQMDYVKEWIDRASVMGAPHIRVFAGKHPKGVSEDDAERNAIGALEEASVYAAEKGIFLGIENHDSIGTADRLLRIVRAVDSPWVGVNLDSGNFTSDDPYIDMEASAPFAVNVQLKTDLKIGGKKVPADLNRIIGILKDSGYAGYAVLEYEEDKDPYKHVPPLLEKLHKLCA